MFASLSFCRISLIFALVTGVASASIAAPPQRTARQHRDSFSPHPVDTIDELVASVKKNPALRHLYARHFGVSETQVIDFFSRALIVKKLPNDRSMTVYGVTKTGHIYPVRTRLRAGELVWTTRSGLPILRWRCANPFTNKLPGTLLSSPPKQARLAKIPRAIPPRTLAQTTPTGIDRSNLMPIRPAEPAGVAGESIQSGPGGLNGVGASNIPAALPGVGGTGIGLPLFLPLLPLTAVISGPSGGGGGFAPPFEPPIDIPEPDTRGLLMLPLFGGAFMLTYGKRMRRRADTLVPANR